MTKQKSTLRQKLVISGFWITGITLPLVLYFCIGLVFGYGMDSGRFSLSMKEFSTWTLLWVPLIIAVACFLWYLTVLIHETGHYLAGKAAGLKLILFGIGPFVLSKNFDCWRIKRVKNKGYAGLCAMVSAHEGSFNPRGFLIHIAGGVGANLFAVFAALGLSLLLPSDWVAIQLALLLLACFSVFDSLNLLPFRSGGFQTDGAIIAAFLSGSPDGMALTEMLRYQGLSMAGIRPSEIPLPSEAIAPPNKSATAEFLLRILREYFHVLDGGDWDKAREVLKSAESLVDQCPSIYQTPLRYEFCFMAACSGDDKQAREWHASVQQSLEKDEDTNACRIKAYYAWKVADSISDARKWADLGLERAHQYQVPGLAKMETNLLQNLLDQTVTQTIQIPS